MKTLLLLIIMPTLLCADKYTDYLETRIIAIQAEINEYNDSMEWDKLCYKIGQCDALFDALDMYNNVNPKPKNYLLPYNYKKKNP